MILINPGSGDIPDKGVGWTNTLEQSAIHCKNWFVKPMRKEGLVDIRVKLESKDSVDGRWTYTFTHKITGISLELDIHGIDNLEAYQKENIFSPRVYWNGSSDATPILEDFSKDGFEPVMTYKSVIQQSNKLRESED